MASEFYKFSAVNKIDIQVIVPGAKLGHLGDNLNLTWFLKLLPVSLCESSTLHECGRFSQEMYSK